MESVTMKTTHLSELKYELYRCTGFGICKGNYNYKTSPCPMSLASSAFEAESPRGIMTMGRDLLEGHQAYSREFSELVFKCTMCGNCRVLCGATNLETSEPLFDPSLIGQAMRTDLVENGMVPAPAQGFLESMMKRGNPFKQPQKQRGKWAEGTGADIFKDQEYLLYVGCVGSFDETGNRIAGSVASVLNAAGVSFGILGADELCDGNEVNKMGERWLFEEMARKNIKLFQDRGIRKIITLTPHAFNSFINDYPQFGGDFEVIHISSYLNKRFKAGSLGHLNPLPRKVTYHDPCLLGRQNGEYEGPRDILKAIPGIELVEMARNRDSSLCCGGGGGNYFTDMIGSGTNSPARTRVREAVETGADTLAVSCPVCANMFQDAIKSEWLEDKLEVKDICELVEEAIN